MRENADETSLVSDIDSMYFISKCSMIEYIIYKITKWFQKKKIRKIILAYKKKLNEKKKPRKTK